jgi:peroxiredoxin (alkyl hydroperoxide reductase subunit C)
VTIDAPAPDFTLPDFSGRPVSVAEFRGKSNVLLVFNRTFA